MLFRNWRFTSTSMLQTSPHWFLSDSAPIWTSWCPCPLWCLGSMIRHYVTVGRVLSAWKQLKTWTYATTRTGCAFIFFLILPIGKIAKELFWTVLISVCTQKDNLHAKVCTDSISYVYSDFNCSGLCAANWRYLTFLSYLHEAADIWHWLWGCAGVFMKRQPCSRALETDPICSRPGWVVKN